MLDCSSNQKRSSGRGEVVVSINEEGKSVWEKRCLEQSSVNLWKRLGERNHWGHHFLATPLQKALEKVKEHLESTNLFERARPTRSKIRRYRLSISAASLASWVGR